jgi:hypothetical protein
MISQEEDELMGDLQLNLVILVTNEQFDEAFGKLSIHALEVLRDQCVCSGRNQLTIGEQVTRYLSERRPA